MQKDDKIKIRIKTGRDYEGSHPGWWHIVKVINVNKENVEGLILEGGKCSCNCCQGHYTWQPDKNIGKKVIINKDMVYDHETYSLSAILNRDELHTG